MLVPPSLVNVERLKDGKVKMGTLINIYIRKWRLLLVVNSTEWTINKSKEIKVRKNIKKISV